ncbi:Uncharacterized protein GBIM_20346 [Gryllus bimaculatus]|nr:Uncharacterized protein GBIM_20346 [Gryllus bimaculatus]
MTLPGNKSLNPCSVNIPISMDSGGGEGGCRKSHCHKRTPARNRVNSEITKEDMRNTPPHHTYEQRGSSYSQSTSGVFLANAFSPLHLRCHRKEDKIPNSTGQATARPKGRGLSGCRLLDVIGSKGVTCSCSADCWMWLVTCCSCCVADCWMDGSYGGTPDGAVRAGRDRDGDPIFVGRAWHEGDLLPAKVHPSHGVCYIPYGGQELSFPQYEILVLK